MQSATASHSQQLTQASWALLSHSAQPWPNLDRPLRGRLPRGRGGVSWMPCARTWIFSPFCTPLLSPGRGYLPEAKGVQQPAAAGLCA